MTLPGRQSGLGFAVMKFGITCLAFIVYVSLMGLLWCIGIPTRASLK